jgi:hypothetical protein
MMKQLVRELDGVQLDYWFAKANGFKDISTKDGVEYSCFSRSWKFIGPIIERENISLNYDEEEGYWCAELPDSTIKIFDVPSFAYGETLLKAAMRCFVQYKLGKYVNVEDE